MQQTQLFGGEHMAFSLSQTTPNTVHAMPGKYGDYGIPMQGTSTGDTEDANGSAIQENLVVELKAPKVVLTKAVLRQIEDYMDYVRKQPLFNSQYRRWKFIAVCSAVDDDVKARYDSQKSKGKKGLVAEIDNYEVYALTWDDVFQSFDLRHAFLLDKLKMDEEAIAAEIAQTAGDEKSKDTADALTALVAN